MKKILLITSILLATTGIKAQQGEIIYRDFEPDVVTEHDDDSIPIDFDGDGHTDVSLVLASISTGYRFGLIAFGEWNISFVENDDTLRPISEITDWYSQLSWTPDFYVENLIVRKTKKMVVVLDGLGHITAIFHIPMEVSDLISDLTNSPIVPSLIILWFGAKPTSQS